MLHRFIPFLIVASLSTFFIFAVFNISWRRVPQFIGLGDVVAVGPSDEEILSGKNIRPDLRTQPKPLKEAPGGSLGYAEKDYSSGFQADSTSPYPAGELKPAGSNYTKTVVVAKMSIEDTSWIEHEFADLIESGLMSQAVYVVDDLSAPYHPPVNKGHESMVYLTYIIDHYDELPDVSIFVHAHRYAWHNNAMQGDDMSQMIRTLSPERVTREGYMNLRCDWEPGCPSWMHPGAMQRNTDKQEEWLMAEAWISLFPLEPIPIVLAQTCCAQFAVSRARIRALDRTRYISLRDWLLATELSDTVSGRIFEYIWQYVFTATPVHCPSMSACYCDGYGLCFGDAKTLDRAFALYHDIRELEDELKVWDKQAEKIALLRLESANGQVPEEADIQVPEPGRGTFLRTHVRRMHEDLQQLQDEARERGRNPRQRALEAGREWKQGDGF